MKRMRAIMTDLKYGLMCAALGCTILPMGTASAQQTAMDTCTSVDACDDVATDFIGKSALLLDNDLYTEAAQHLYPVMLTNKVSPLVQTATRNQFSYILETAGLYELAAEQKDIANSTTSAPSSVGLLEWARILSRAEEMEDETLAAYAEAAELAVRAANLFTIDEIISDYQALGKGANAAGLRGQRTEAAARASLACEAAGCTARPLIDAVATEPAAPVYPSRALSSGAGAECRVTMNVTEDGLPVDIVADCTDPLFIDSAAEAARQTGFQPRYRNGRPEPRHRVVLPFTYSVD
ncbi:MAG: energy transducer TonB [Hyphomonadaceae bacterium]